MKTEKVEAFFLKTLTAGRGGEIIAAMKITRKSLF